MSLNSWISKADMFIHEFYSIKLHTDKIISWPYYGSNPIDPLSYFQITSNKIILKAYDPRTTEWQASIIQACILNELNQSREIERHFSVFLTAILLKYTPELRYLFTDYIIRWREAHTSSSYLRYFYQLFSNFTQFPLNAWKPRLQKIIKNPSNPFALLSNILYQISWYYYTKKDISIMIACLQHQSTNGLFLQSVLQFPRSTIYYSLKKILHTVKKRIIANYSPFKLHRLQINSLKLPNKLASQLIHFYDGRSKFSDVATGNIFFRLPLFTISRFLSNVYLQNLHGSFIVFQNNHVDIGICLDGYAKNSWTTMQKHHKSIWYSPYSAFLQPQKSVTLSQTELKVLEHVLKFNNATLSSKTASPVSISQQRRIIRKLKQNNFLTETVLLLKPPTLQTFVFLVLLKHLNPVDTQNMDVKLDDEFSNSLNYFFHVSHFSTKSPALEFIKAKPWPYITIEYGILHDITPASINRTFVAQIKLSALLNDILPLFHHPNIIYLGNESHPSGSNIVLLPDYYKSGEHKVSDRQIVQLYELIKKNMP